MNGLLYLTSDDFKIVQHNTKNYLCHRINGFSLILFYSTHCDHCNEFIPIFKQLVGSIAGCQFGMMNVMKNKECVIKSKNTITPLEYVPFIVLYTDGKPYMKYSGPPNVNEIKHFVVDVANKFINKNKIVDSEKIKTNERSIPEYSYATPLYGDKKSRVCWLNMEEAYTN